jgi:hypothetical protein
MKATKSTMNWLRATFVNGIFDKYSNDVKIEDFEDDKEPDFEDNKEPEDYEDDKEPELEEDDGVFVVQLEEMIDELKMWKFDDTYAEEE